MSLPQNISSVDVNNSTQFFNNFFTNFGTVSSNHNDALIGYFEKQTKGNKQAALALASAVIYTSMAQDTDPMVVLEQFTKVAPGDLNAYLTMFLNLNRIGTSYLGINNQPTVNKYVKRAILA